MANLFVQDSDYDANLGGVGSWYKDLGDFVNEDVDTELTSDRLPLELDIAGEQEHDPQQQQQPSPLTTTHISGPALAPRADDRQSIQVENTSQSSAYAAGPLSSFGSLSYPLIGPRSFPKAYKALWMDGYFTVEGQLSSTKHRKQRRNHSTNATQNGPIPTLDSQGTRKYGRGCLKCSLPSGNSCTCEVFCQGEYKKEALENLFIKETFEFFAGSELATHMAKLQSEITGEYHSFCSSMGYPATFTFDVSIALGLGQSFSEPLLLDATHVFTYDEGEPCRPSPAVARGLVQMSENLWQSQYSSALAQKRAGGHTASHTSSSKLQPNSSRCQNVDDPDKHTQRTSIFAFNLLNIRDPHIPPAVQNLMHFVTFLGLLQDPCDIRVPAASIVCDLVSANATQMSKGKEILSRWLQVEVLQTIITLCERSLKAVLDALEHDMSSSSINLVRLRDQTTSPQHQHLDISIYCLRLLIECLQKYEKRSRELEKSKRNTDANLVVVWEMLLKRRSELLEQLKFYECFVGNARPDFVTIKTPCKMLTDLLRGVSVLPLPRDLVGDNGPTESNLLEMQQDDKCLKPQNTSSGSPANYESAPRILEPDDQSLDVARIHNSGATIHSCDTIPLPRTSSPEPNSKSSKTSYAAHEGFHFSDYGCHESSITSRSVVKTPSRKRTKDSSSSGEWTSHTRKLPFKRVKSYERGDGTLAGIGTSHMLSRDSSTARGPTHHGTGGIFRQAWNGIKSAFGIM